MSAPAGGSERHSAHRRAGNERGSPLSTTQKTRAPRGRRPLAALAAALAAAVLAPGAAGAQQPPVQPGPQQASEALAAAQDALSGEGSGTQAAAADPTIALNQVAAALPALSDRERRAARMLLARPDDGPGGDPLGGYPKNASVAFASSPNFCVHWIEDPGLPDAPDLTDADANSVPDYVDRILEIAEHSRAVEVAPGPLGWAPPKPDLEGCGPDPSRLTDIYLRQLGPDGLFGYAAPDPGQGRSRSQHGYMVIDDDYSPAEYDGFDEPLDAARVTLAHEYNHLLQHNYDVFQDLWMFESTATWAEEHAYPEINDYVNFVRAFAKFPGEPITDVVRTAGDPRGRRPYGAAVWNHWLDSGGGGYGSDAIRRAWEISDSGPLPDFALGAYDRAIKAHGGRGFAREFVAFTAATAEWRAGGKFPDAAQYSDVKRQGKLGRRAKRLRLDHTAARFLRVPANQNRVVLQVRGPRKLQAGVALVGRSAAGVTTRKRMLNRRGRATVRLSGARGLERVTAVIVNADMRVNGFSGADWNYRKDGQRFTARLR